MYSEIIDTLLPCVFPAVPHRFNHPSLLRGDQLLPATHAPSCPSYLQPCHGPLSHQLALKLSKGCKKVKDKSARRRACVKLLLDRDEVDPSGGGRSSSGGSGSSSKPRWSGAGSSVTYTPGEIRALTPVRETVEKLVLLPERRDYFLCHAWDDRAGSAKELHDMLESRRVSVWFSEKDVSLGTSLLREIDKGLAKSRVGIVLVTPALLRRLQCESIADKELSALLARDQLIPIVHGTTYEDLRNVSPLLASRSGLSTRENTMVEAAAKLAELVANLDS